MHGSSIIHGDLRHMEIYLPQQYMWTGHTCMRSPWSEIRGVRDDNPMDWVVAHHNILQEAGVAEFENRIVAERHAACLTRVQTLACLPMR